MKAFTFFEYGPPEVLHLNEIKKPEPNDSEVLIKIHAVSINDWDWGLIHGTPFVIRSMIGLSKPKKVQIPGVDIAGVIEAVGSQVSKFKVGDCVLGDLSENGFGGFAEYVCAYEKSLTLKPENMPFEEAAALPHASMLALQGLIDSGKTKPKQKILINGAGGGVGTLGIQIAKQFNIEEITAVDSSDKMQMLKSLGYNHTIDYKKEDFTKSGKKYDLILDVKINRSIFKYARTLNKNGIYVTVGGSMRRILQAFLLGPFISLFCKKKILVLGLKPNKDMDYIIDLYNQGKLRPVIEGPYKFEKIPELLTYFGNGKHKGKITIAV